MSNTREQLRKLDGLCDDLVSEMRHICKFLGLFRSSTGGWVSKRNPEIYQSGSLVAQEAEQPVNKKEFNLLLDHLGLRLVDVEAGKKIEKLPHRKEV